MSVRSPSKACACGWLRPLISVTTRTGAPPPDDIIPVYSCPSCGLAYVPEEIPLDVAREIILDLLARGTN